MILYWIPTLKRENIFKSNKYMFLRSYESAQVSLYYLATIYFADLFSQNGYLVALAAMMFRVTHPNGQNNTTKKWVSCKPEAKSTRGVCGDSPTGGVCLRQRHLTDYRTHIENELNERKKQQKINEFNRQLDITHPFFL